MTKKDLKTGMIVEYRNGEQRRVLLNTEISDILVDDKWQVYMDLDSYNQELIFNNKDKIFLDIMYVYGLKHTLIWRRKEPLKVTMKQIEEKFGQPVVIVEEDL